MQTLTIVIFACLAALVLAPVLLAAWTIWKIRGTRVVTCPDNHQTVAVEVAAAHAAFTRLGGKPTLRLAECTRWPEKAGCGQECLRQIEAAPEGCLVRRILEEWFADKSCVVCAKALGPAHWMDHAPALLRADGVTVGWDEIVPEELPETLRSHHPVCFDCHVAATFRRKFPQLVVDRHRDNTTVH